MKKWLSLLLALCMALTLSLSFAEGAEDTWTEDSLAEAADIRTEIGDDYTGKTVILHSNDVHGQLDGYAWIAGLRTEFESRGANVILVDAGDFSQGTVYVSTTKGSTAVDMMNAAKYDLVTLGNHEFDFGYVQLMDNLSKAEFKTLCANVTLDETGEPILPGTCVQEYTFEDGTGLKIGFFGLETPETATKVNPGLVSMITFSAFDKLYESAQKAIDELKSQQVDLTIGLVHLGVDAESKANGYRSLDLLEKTTGADLLIDGHSHTVMTAGPNGEPIVSSGTRFEYVGAIVIDHASKQIEDRFLIPTYLGSKLYEAKFVDESVLATAKDIMAKVDAEYSTAFATTEVDLNGDRAPGNRTEETNLGDMITDAMVWSVVKEGGIEQVEPNAVVGITNGGGIRAPIPAGEFSRKDINTVLPFGNTVAVVYVTGAELLEVLEASTFCTPDPIGGFPQTSGIQWTLDTTKAYDQGAVYMMNGKETSYYAPASINRVTITAINGEPFDPSATYAVVTNNFCTAGGDTYNVFGQSTSTFDTGIPLDNALMSYVEEVLQGVVSAETYGAPQGRLTIIQ
ncbi:MAG: bifunctional metallophosphatase/5'-nucleotidase [Clostridia bacterium]|nr:bifunctional metallophosphatase/5'-nucleotidase [Clostridia bacterium]